MQSDIIKELADVVTNIPFNRILGLRLDEFQEDRAVLSFSMKEELVGNYLYGILHGGVISSVLDMAGGVVSMVAALHRYQDKNIDEMRELLAKASTINLHVNYVHPGKGERFIATANVLHSGRRLCFTRIELHNEEERLIATGAGTYLIGP